MIMTLAIYQNCTSSGLSEPWSQNHTRSLGQMVMYVPKVRAANTQTGLHICLSLIYNSIITWLCEELLFGMLAQMAIFCFICEQRIALTSLHICAVIYLVFEKMTYSFAWLNKMLHMHTLFFDFYIPSLLSVINIAILVSELNIWAKIWVDLFSNRDVKQWKKGGLSYTWQRRKRGRYSTHTHTHTHTHPYYVIYR